MKGSNLTLNKCVVTDYGLRDKGKAILISENLNTVFITM